MTEARKVIVEKATATAEGINQMDGKTKFAHPSKEFGSDYNRLREAAMKEMPSAESLMPPSVQFEKMANGGERTTVPFSEIMVYCRQIARMLNTQ